MEWWGILPAGNWVCLYGTSRTSRGWTLVIGFVLHDQPRVARRSLQVGFVCTTAPGPRLGGTWSPLARPNWVCLYDESRRRLFVEPALDLIEGWASPPHFFRLPVCAGQIGFVFLHALVGQIRHNHFPIKHVPLLALRRKLGLFRTKASDWLLTTDNGLPPFGFVCTAVFQPTTGSCLLALFRTNSHRRGTEAPRTETTIMSLAKPPRPPRMPGFTVRCCPSSLPSGVRCPPSAVIRRPFFMVSHQ